jgi:hypothetical protein
MSDRSLDCHGARVIQGRPVFNHKHEEADGEVADKREEKEPQNKKAKENELNKKEEEKRKQQNS